MPKQIKVELSVESIDRAIKEIQAERRRQEKAILELIDKMVAVGEDYAINAVGHVDTGETLASITGYRNGNKGVIVAGGAAVWLEFGTGTLKNHYQHPPAQGENANKIVRWGKYGDGYGDGSKYPEGWWYKDESGQSHHTKGIEANMFMWRTAQRLQELFPKMAKEVFEK